MSKSSHRKKKKPHHCKNHPRETARGKCSQCGKWVCADCVVLKKGQFYCADTCLPTGVVAHSPVSETAQGAAPAPPSSPVESAVQRVSQENTTSRMVAWAGATLAVCLLVFVLVQARANSELKRRVRVLEMRQSELIEILKRKHRRETAEKAAVQKDSSTATSDTVGRKVIPAPNYKAVKSPYGVPLNFNNGSPSKKMVALTFDGGAHANAAPDILDTLNSRNVKVTMFLTGNFIRRYTTLVRRIVDEGHEVGNHTYSHPHLTSWVETRTQTTLPNVSESFLKEELDKANKVMKDKTGVELMPLWRAPYGDINRQICLWGQNAGYLHVGWRQGRTWSQNLDSNDWIPDEETPGYHSPDEVYRKVMHLGRQKPYGINGGIVLMHLGTVRKEQEKQVHRILGKLIDDLREEGYEFVTVSVLLKEAGVDMTLLNDRVAGRATEKKRNS